MLQYHDLDFEICFGDRFLNLNHLQFSLTSFKLFALQQIHSNKIIATNQLSNADIFTHKGDGLLSRSSHEALLIQTADCLPIAIISEKNTPTFGMIHAGWRGIAAGIFIKAIRLIAGNHPSEVRVYIGPHILWSSYEVSKEVVDAITKNFTKEERNQCVQELEHQKFLLSLQNVILIQAQHLRIPSQKIVCCKIDTYKNPFYHSFRRNKTSERNLSYIIFNPPKSRKRLT